jgi:hypothetical protein
MECNPNFTYTLESATAEDNAYNKNNKLEQSHDARGHTCSDNIFIINGV